MKIIAFGDIHMAHGALDAIPGLSEADFVVITGDLTNWGGTAEAETVLAAVRRKNPNIYALPGNLDRPEVSTYLEQLGISLHGSGVIRGDLGLFGVGGSNSTPFNTPIEFTEEELAKLVQKAFNDAASAQVRVLVSHAPPHGTATDIIGDGIHVGSTSIRRFIEEVQPDFCFTGHIHESRAEDTIGRTLILNPGVLKRPGWIEFTRNREGRWEAYLN
jgi:Icc-related predicted phosphoesterase